MLCLLALAFGFAGCGPSKTERDAKERERRALEEKSREEAEQANKAITDMNKKMFGKKAQPAPESEPEKKP
ncbi:MAG: hypothetical protein JNN01_19845 [Opitutaceae bacterium]|nr:hypothetical protein [Opitutaceae bacterium]